MLVQANQLSRKHCTQLPICRCIILINISGNQIECPVTRAIVMHRAARAIVDFADTLGSRDLSMVMEEFKKMKSKDTK